MIFRVEIDCGSPAFGETPEARDAEIGRLLQIVTHQIAHGRKHEPLLDRNNERCGSYVFEATMATAENSKGTP